MMVRHDHRNKQCFTCGYMIVGDMITCIHCEQELCKKCIYVSSRANGLSLYPHSTSHTIVKIARTLPTCLKLRALVEFRALVEGVPTLFPSTVATIASVAGTRGQSTLVDE